MITSKRQENECITLDFYQPEYKKILHLFNLPEEQKRFTGMPDKVLEICMHDENRYPIVILSETTPVGFFVLHLGQDIAPFTDNPCAILLRAFSVNHIHQGKGYAKKGMKLIPGFVLKHFPGINEIVLAVNERNVAAKSLYDKSGFEDRGIKKVGKIGMQYILHYTLTSN